jgi:leucyl-tRNA synthetase
VTCTLPLLSISSVCPGSFPSSLHLFFLSRLHFSPPLPPSPSVCVCVCVLKDVIGEYGADTVRVFMLFKAPPELDMQWDTQAIRGVLRWLGRVWTLAHEHIEVCQRRGEREEGEKEEGGEEGEQKIVSATHRAIQEVTASFTERHTFNVAVSELMILSNTLRDGRSLRGSPAYHSALETLCLLLAPMAPHITSQLWEDLEGVRRVLGLPNIKGDVLSQPWPQCDESLQNRPTDTVEFVLQVNGRKRAVLSLPSHLVDSEDLSREVVRGAVGEGVIGEEGEVERVIVVPHRHIANIVTR